MNEQKKTFVRRGKGADPKPITEGMYLPRLIGCPDCNGRGWFLIHPFKTGGSNGVGGLGNMCQCLTCLDAKEYFDEHGELPAEIAELIKDKTE